MPGTTTTARHCVAHPSQSEGASRSHAYDFVRKVSTTTANGKKKLNWHYHPPKEREGVVRYSSPEVKGVFLAQLVLLGCEHRLASGSSQLPLLLLSIAQFLLGLHSRRFVARICDCGTMKSDVFGLEGPSHRHTVGTE
jgi:hypothetical protein